MSEFAAGAAASRVAKLETMLRPDQIDNLGAAVLVLARELWVVKDRQRVLEALLAEHGVVPPGAVADHQPGPELADALSNERTRYLRALMTALAPSDEG